MESLTITRVRRLAHQDPASVALTAYLPLKSEENVVSPERLGKVQEKAEKALAKLSDLKEIESFRTNLDYVLSQVLEADYAGGTWLLAVTPSLAEGVFVPFLLPEEINVGKALKPWPAFYALHRVKTVFVGLVSENTVRWFEAIGTRLFPLPLSSEVKEALQQLHKARQNLQSISLDNPHYNELFAQMARSAYSMALVKYTDILREVVSFYLVQERVPVLLMGEERLLQDISRGLEGKGSLVLVNGIPEASSLEHIQQQVAHYLEHHRTGLEQMYLPFLAYSEKQAPQEIWALLQDSLPSAPLLFVEEGYTFPAEELTGQKRSLPSRDGVDLLIAAVCERGGEVLFLPPGKLPHPLMFLVP